MSNPASRILLVDDEPALLKMVSEHLGHLGYAVTSANTTEQALAEMEISPASYSMAVLDATMSGLSLFELANRLLNANASLRVLTASGYPIDITELEAAAPGRVEFLPKPFSPATLADVIRRMLASQKEDL